MSPAVTRRRGFVASLFVIVCLSLAGAVHASPPSPTPKGFAPYDLTYLPASGPYGILALRPAAIVRCFPIPLAGATTHQFLGMLLSQLSDCDLTKAEPPDLADLDECVLGMSFSVTFPSDKDQGKLLFGAGTPGCLRTTKPFDWTGAVRKWFPQAIPTDHAGRTYLRIPWKAGVALPAEFKKRTEGSYLAVFIADGRTLAIGNDTQIELLIDRLKAGKKPPEPPGWQEVNRDLVALALDQRQLRCARGKWPDEPPEFKHVHVLADAVKVAAVGVALKEGPDGGCLAVRLVATTADTDSATRAAQAIKTLVTAGLAALDRETKGTTFKGVRMVHEIFDHGTLSHESGMVRGRIDVPVSFLRLCAAAAAATTKAKEAAPPSLPAPPPAPASLPAPSPRSPLPWPMSGMRGADSRGY